MLRWIRNSRSLLQGGVLRDEASERGSRRGGGEPEQSSRDGFGIRPGKIGDHDTAPERLFEAVLDRRARLQQSRVPLPRRIDPLQEP